MNADLFIVRPEERRSVLACGQAHLYPRHRSYFTFPVGIRDRAKKAFCILIWDAIFLLAAFGLIVFIYRCITD